MKKFFSVFFEVIFFCFLAGGVSNIFAQQILAEGSDQKKEKKIGYDNTPFLPASKWRVHDGNRPQPPVITPGPFRTDEPPADAIVLFDGKDMNIKTGVNQEILKALVDNFGRVVPFNKLEIGSSDCEASITLRDSIRHIREKLEKLPVVIKNRRGAGYVMVLRD